MAAECVVLVVVRTVVVVCVVVCEQHLVCELGGQVSEARVVRTFLANDAAYLTLSRAVTQLRRSEIVTPGVGLTVCVVCGVSNESVGFGRAFSLQSQSECIICVAPVQINNRVDCPDLGPSGMSSWPCGCSQGANISDLLAAVAVTLQ